MWNVKGIEFLQQILIFNAYIFTIATRCCRPLIFQTINSVRSKSLSLKYQRFTPSCCKNIEMRTFEFVAKTQITFVIIF